ncbi:amidohydrolase family protein [Nannocystis radixulma]|uniref:Amidohydrolase family protein n=1 Tax=Nannocystis radixulma TaxID=2995305 RepID=A0ABT5AWN1_9BACT|nr:amidohydrolase family protein [Nannocystis radixulma]MDC0666245.1 amidohydrolase family protein [Nannocystis radixulma]
MRPRLPRTVLTFSGLALLACPGPQTSPVPPPEPAAIAATLVITDVRLFDGEKVVERTSVAVDGDTIVAVAPGVRVVDSATRVDGRGLTLLPGLIDAHTHIQSADNLRQALMFGVTTELDMFSLPAVTGPLRKIVAGANGRMLADFRSSGILATAPGGHGTEYGVAIPTLTGPDQAPAFVAGRLAEGSDYVKIVLDDGGAFGRPIPTLALDTVRALVAAAHAQGQLAVVHVSSQREAMAALEAGADGLAHVFSDGLASPAFVQLAADRRVFVADTLPVLQGLCEPGVGAQLARDPELGPFLGPADVRALTMRWPIAVPKESCEHALASVSALHQAGVALLASTDAPNPGTVHGASLHEALALLVRAGLPASAALAAATSVPADRFKLSDRGRVAVGKRADLLLVRGDPTADILKTRAIEAVWKAGHRLDRDGYRQGVKQEHEALAALRQAPPPPGLKTGKIADFEAAELAAEFGAGWQPGTDALIGGTSTVALSRAKKGARKSKGALRIAGTVAATDTPAKWAGAMFFPGDPAMQPANLGGFSKIVFAARGDAATSLTLMVFAQQNGVVPLRKEIAVGREWSEHTVTFAELGDLEPYALTALFFGATQPGAFALELDDVRLE